MDDKHYGDGTEATRVLDALDPVRAGRLAALDQFHVGGVRASRRLAGRAKIGHGQRVLDVGSGLGGPARLLVDETGADVTGIDFTQHFCWIAQALSVQTGNANCTRFCAADALVLPFADDVFDAVWTEHMAMNIAARDRLYRELRRVARSGGILALYDVVEGSQSVGLLYPVPWASNEVNSHLVDADSLRRVILDAGWTERIFVDETAAALDWLSNVPQSSGFEGPTLRDVMGPEFPTMIANLRDNFEAGRLGAVQAIFENSSASI